MQAWGGKAVDLPKGLVAGLKLGLLEPLMSKGLPSAEALAAVDNLAEVASARHAGIGRIHLSVVGLWTPADGPASLGAYPGSATTRGFGGCASFG